MDDRQDNEYDHRDKIQLYQINHEETKENEKKYIKLNRKKEMNKCYLIFFK